MASLPGKLPIGVPRRLGLPYHGKVQGGKVYLPGGATRDHAQPSDGSAFVVQHPRHAAAVLTEKEQESATAAGHQWLEYAYLSGVTKSIGGQSLGEARWIYCDANNAWVLRYEKNYDTRTIDVYAESLFGRFDDVDRTETTDRLVFSYAPVNDWLFNVPLAQFSIFAFPSKDGRKMLMNLMYLYSFSSSPYYLHLNQPRYGSSATMATLEEVILVTMTGNGDTNAATLATGITGSAAVLVDDFYETFTDTESETGANGGGCLAPVSKEMPCDTTFRSGSYVYTREYSGVLLYYLTADGVVTTMDYSSDYSSGSAWEETYYWETLSEEGVPTSCGSIGWESLRTTTVSSTSSYKVGTNTIVNSTNHVTTLECSGPGGYQSPCDCTETTTRPDPSGGEYLAIPVLMNRQNIRVAENNLSFTDSFAWYSFEGGSLEAQPIANFASYDIEKAQWYTGTTTVGTV